MLILSLDLGLAAHSEIEVENLVNFTSSMVQETSFYINLAAYGYVLNPLPLHVDPLD